MIRNLEELIKKIAVTSVNDDVTNEIEYQRIMNAKKQKEDELLPKGVWNEESINWSEIELDCWHLITTKGYDLKIVVIWIESLIVLHGFDILDFCFKALLEIVKAQKYFFLNTEDYKLNYISYLDKSITKIICTMNLNLNSISQITLEQFEKFHLENFHEFQVAAAQISSNVLMHLHDIYEVAFASFNALSDFLREMRCYNLNKLATLFSQFNEFLKYRENLIFDEATETNAEETEKNVFYYKNEAFKRIEEALEILERVDMQNLSIPILSKVLKWKDLSLIEIFEDFQTPAQIEAFIGMLKN